MGRRVKCQITKETGDSKDFFKAPNGKYYKSEEVYNDWLRTTILRKECIKEICDIAGYNEEIVVPAFLNKIINDIGKKVGYDILLETIRRNRQSFEWANEHKEFSSELNRLFYYKSIITNHVVEVYKEEQERKEQGKRMEKDTAPPENLDVGIVGGKGKDLSALLEQF